jgi:hypothetical protein
MLAYAANFVKDPLLGIYEYHLSRSKQILSWKVGKPSELQEADLFAAFSLILCAPNKRELGVHAAGCKALLTFLAAKSDSTSSVNILAPRISTWANFQECYIKGMIPSQRLGFAQRARSTGFICSTMNPLPLSNLPEVLTIVQQFDDLVTLSYNCLVKNLPPVDSRAMRSYAQSIQADLEDPDFQCALAGEFEVTFGWTTPVRQPPNACESSFFCEFKPSQFLWEYLSQAIFYNASIHFNSDVLGNESA